MQHSPRFDDGRPEHDEGFASELVGKRILVGVTVEGKRGEFKRHEQFYGKVVSADARVGIKLSLLGARSGESKTLPPATHVFEPAPKGVYTLRSTGERVVDPDFTCTWLLVQPDA